MTAQEELDQVNKAISAILSGGQSYSINSGGGSRTVTRADLNALYARKSYLENQIAADACGRAGQRLVPGW